MAISLFDHNQTSRCAHEAFTKQLCQSGMFYLFFLYFFKNYISGERNDLLVVKQNFDGNAHALFRS